MIISKKKGNLMPVRIGDVARLCPDCEVFTDKNKDAALLYCIDCTLILR